MVSFFVDFVLFIRSLAHTHTQLAQQASKQASIRISFLNPIQSSRWPTCGHDLIPLALGSIGCRALAAIECLCVRARACDTRMWQTNVWRHHHHHQQQQPQPQPQKPAKPGLKKPVGKSGKKGGKSKVAAAPLKSKIIEAKKVVNPLFEKRAKNFGIGWFYFLLSIYAFFFDRDQSNQGSSSSRVELCLRCDDKQSMYSRGEKRLVHMLKLHFIDKHMTEHMTHSDWLTDSFFLDFSSSPPS